MKNQKLRINFKKLKKNYRGFYYTGKNLIEIQNDLSQKETIETLYHEFTHYVVDKFFAGEILEKPNKDTKVIQLTGKYTNKHEEQLCERIERAAWRAVRDFFHTMLPKARK
jgi:hypothetical protein